MTDTGKSSTNLNKLQRLLEIPMDKSSRTQPLPPRAHHPLLSLDDLALSGHIDLYLATEEAISIETNERPKDLPWCPSKLWIVSRLFDYELWLLVAHCTGVFLWWVK